MDFPKSQCGTRGCSFAFLGPWGEGLKPSFLWNPRKDTCQSQRPWQANPVPHVTSFKSWKEECGVQCVNLFSFLPKSLLNGHSLSHFVAEGSRRPLCTWHQRTGLFSHFTGELLPPKSDEL